MQRLKLKQNLMRLMDYWNNKFVTQAWPPTLVDRILTGTVIEIEE